MPEDTRDAAPASLIVIGPPSVDDPEANGPAGLRSLVLVEPDRAKLLSEHFKTRREVAVINASVGRTAGTAKLRDFNFPGLRSTSPPNAELRELLPGIRVRRTRTVDVITPAQLLAQIGDLAQPVHLHINLPGGEDAILKSWHKSEGLSKLALVRVRCSHKAMFKGGQSSRVLTDWMQSQSFVASINRADPDWPEIVFRTNPMVRRLDEAERTVADQSTELVQKRSQVMALKTQIAQAQATLAVRDTRIAELEADQEAARESARAAKKALAAA